MYNAYYMENAYGILVIILSSFLALFLLLAITLTVMLIRLTKTIGRVVEKAEGAVGNVEAAAAVFKNAAGPLAAGKFLVNIADLFVNKKKGK